MADRDELEIDELPGKGSFDGSGDVASDAATATTLKTRLAKARGQKSFRWASPTIPLDDPKAKGPLHVASQVEADGRRDERYNSTKKLGKRNTVDVFAHGPSADGNRSTGGSGTVKSFRGSGRVSSSTPTAQKSHVWRLQESPWGELKSEMFASLASLGPSSHPFERVGSDGGARETNASFAAEEMESSSALPDRRRSSFLWKLPYFRSQNWADELQSAFMFHYLTLRFWDPSVEAIFQRKRKAGCKRTIAALLVVLSSISVLETVVDGVTGESFSYSFAAPLRALGIALPLVLVILLPFMRSRRDALFNAFVSTAVVVQWVVACGGPFVVALLSMTKAESCLREKGLFETAGRSLWPWQRDNTSLLDARSISERLLLSTEGNDSAFCFLRLSGEMSRHVDFAVHRLFALTLLQALAIATFLTSAMFHRLTLIFLFMFSASFAGLLVLQQCAAQLSLSPFDAFYFHLSGFYDCVLLLFFFCVISVAAYRNEKAIRRDFVTAYKAEVEDLLHKRERRKKEQEDLRSKQRFFSSVSHEIRTPLHGIVGLTELLDHKLAGANSEHRQFTEALKKSALRLFNLVNDVIEVTKIDEGILTLERTTFDLRKLIERCSSEIADRASDKGLEIILDIEEGIADTKVSGDEKKMQQVISNLLSNAVKFSEEGCILLSVSTKAGGPRRPATAAHRVLGRNSIDVASAMTRERLFRISVQDQGIGMNDDIKRRLFERFLTVSHSRADHVDGTGLGLHICKSLLQIMGGRISVSSAVGKGSTFVVSVPLAVEATGAEQWRRSAGRRPLRYSGGEVSFGDEGVSAVLRLASPFKETRKALQAVSAKLGVSVFPCPVLVETSGRVTVSVDDVCPSSRAVHVIDIPSSAVLRIKEAFIEFGADAESALPSIVTVCRRLLHLQPGQGVMILLTPPLSWTAPKGTLQWRGWDIERVSSDGSSHRDWMITEKPIRCDQLPALLTDRMLDVLQKGNEAKQNAKALISDQGEKEGTDEQSKAACNTFGKCHRVEDDYDWLNHLAKTIDPVKIDQSRGMGATSISWIHTEASYADMGLSRLKFVVLARDIAVLSAMEQLLAGARQCGAMSVQTVSLCRLQRDIGQGLSKRDKLVLFVSTEDFPLGELEVSLRNAVCSLSIDPASSVSLVSLTKTLSSAASRPLMVPGLKCSYVRFHHADLAIAIQRMVAGMADREEENGKEKHLRLKNNASRWSFASSGITSASVSGGEAVAPPVVCLEKSESIAGPLPSFPEKRVSVKTIDAAVVDARRSRYCLVIEDDKVNQLIARKMLERLSIKVVCVEDGVAALQALESCEEQIKAQTLSNALDDSEAVPMSKLPDSLVEEVLDGISEGSSPRRSSDRLSRSVSLMGLQISYRPSAKVSTPDQDAVTRIFDFVLMDCQMPRMDGFECAKEIRKRRWVFANLPIIGCSAGASEKKCVDAGMNAFLKKPFNVAQLRDTLRSLNLQQN